MKKSYVYKITCKITGEFYFGSSFRAKSDQYWGSGRRIKEQIAQYGKENFIKEILGEFDDRVEAHKVEYEYIEQFRHDEKCLNQMLNRRFGSFSEETRSKIGAANAISNLGKHFSEEHRAKIGAASAIAMLGKHHIEEVKARISAALRGKPHPHGKHWRKNPITGKREYYD